MLDSILGKTFYSSFDVTLFRASRTKAVHDPTFPSGDNAAFGQGIDFVNRRYYWTSNDGSTIYRVDFNLENEETVVSNPSSGSSRGLCIHPWNGDIFYQHRQSTSPFTIRIRRCGLDGSGDIAVFDLTSGQTFEADGLAVSKADEYVFIAMDTGTPSPSVRHIKRMNADGSGVTSLYSANDFTPRELCVDNTHGLLFFNDGFTKIKSLPFGGGTPTTILDRTASSPPLPVWDDGTGGTGVFIIDLCNYSHKLDRLFFNLRGGQSPHDPTDLGLWSMNVDGSDIQPEYVYPNIYNKTTGLSDQACLDSGRWRVGPGFETAGNSTDATL